jgi:hypothetical protein
VDPKKYRYHSDKKREEGAGGAGDDLGPIHNPILQTETGRSLKGRSIAELKINCPFCKENYDFPGVVHDERKEDSLSGLICLKCKAGLPDQYVMNRVNLFLKQLLVIYYQGNYECQEPACKAKTRQPLINNRCVVTTCKGKMIPEYSEFVTNDTLRYLQGLFNVRKYIHESKLSKQEHEVINYEEFTRLKAKVDSVLNRSKYNKVDLKSIFSFMVKN